MHKPAKVQDKYYLKSVHEDIDLLDRKLAHLQKYDVFDTPAAREAAANKITAARELLAKIARRLMDEGIQFKESDLPRSFRSENASKEEPAPTQP